LKCPECWSEHVREYDEGFICLDCGHTWSIKEQEEYEEERQEEEWEDEDWEDDTETEEFFDEEGDW
jgi:uncharacterized Zn ribbon protein